ncbi:N-acetylmuramoyl-L-alanine amidase [Chlamydia felis Fe/C-56]|uniref:N-acetylmuramoyl-L-alanine amidase n=1 Tax=Chlamydia felis (strain Fe/C-56) TaxID=264202 RepID=Q256I0_CHLFF|nr:LysM peptidoglycan-binding domain-containing protein [Chlamydia felis]BAE80808.1 N-acetylmuramoyl-L-alanine amidase [Chlamydia felis Fe/C-56]
MHVNCKYLFYCGLWFCLGAVLPAEAGKSPSLQAVLAEVEDASAKLLCHEADIQMLADRIDEQDSKIQKLSSTKPDALTKQIQQLEIEYKTLAKTVSVLTASVKDIQSTLQNKLQEVQQHHKTLSQDIRLLRRSLLALVDGSSPETYTDLSNEVPSHIHVVQPGETLGKIATKYKIPVAELKKLNKLNSDVIYANQKLCLPEHKK